MLNIFLRWIVSPPTPSVCRSQSQSRDQVYSNNRNGQQLASIFTCLETNLLNGSIVTRECFNVFSHRHSPFLFLPDWFSLYIGFFYSPLQLLAPWADTKSNPPLPLIRLYACKMNHEVTSTIQFQLIKLYLWVQFLLILIENFLS